MEAVRWGILSTAKIATQKVIPGMRRAARAEVAAIASRDIATAQAVADQLGIPRAHGSYEALLDDPGIDAIYIPLPNHLHMEWTIRALQAGKHVLCEKPLAVTAADAEAMFAAADAAGRRLVEAFMYRHHPSWLAVRRLVDEGRIGELRSVDSWFSYFNNDPANIRNIAAYGGGALYDIGCYNVNLSRWLFGGEPMSVSGAIRRDPAFGVDILTSGTLGFANGVATFTCATQVEPDQRVHIYGSTGRILVEIPFNIPPDRPSRVQLVTGRTSPADPHVEVLEFPPADPYACEVDAFAAVILDGAEPPVPPSDAAANLRVIEELFRVAAG